MKKLFTAIIIGSMVQFVLACPGGDPGPCGGETCIGCEGCVWSEQEGYHCDDYQPNCYGCLECVDTVCLISQTDCQVLQCTWKCLPTGQCVDDPEISADDCASCEYCWNHHCHDGCDGCGTCSKTTDQCENDQSKCIAPVGMACGKCENLECVTDQSVCEQNGENCFTCVPEVFICAMDPPKCWEPSGIPVCGTCSVLGYCYDNDAMCFGCESCNDNVCDDDTERCFPEITHTQCVGGFCI